jgi:hypothetical protein
MNFASLQQSATANDAPTAKTAVKMYMRHTRFVNTSGFLYFFFKIITIFTIATIAVRSEACAGVSRVAKSSRRSATSTSREVVAMLGFSHRQ